jgi:hypothetical protein
MAQPKTIAPPKVKRDAWQAHDVDPYMTTPQGTMFERPAAPMSPGVKRLLWGAGLATLLALVFAATQYMPVPEWLYSTTGTLVIESNPPGVEVFVNGASRGKTPLTLKVESGQHEVELKALDKPRIFNVTVARGQRVAQYVELPQGRRR